MRDELTSFGMESAMKGRHTLLAFVIFAISVSFVIIGCGNEKSATQSTTDLPPFTVKSYVPQDGDIGVPVSSVITAFFNRPVDPFSVTSADFTLTSDTGRVLGSVSPVNGSLQFTPADSLLYGVTYTATLSSAVKDTYGNSLGTPASWTFVTAYRPDTWHPMAQNSLWDNTFHPRDFHLVWTGEEMIVWGPMTGSTLMTGGRYNPATDTWRPVSLVNAPTSPSTSPGPAIWTGEEMIIYSHEGAWRYDPESGTWSISSTVDQLLDMDGGYVVWTGSEMIVIGGIIGGIVVAKYDPQADSWIWSSHAGNYNVRTALWTESVILTGLSGYAAYNPLNDTWTGISDVNRPTQTAGWDYVTIWTGSEMIVWGGWNQVSSFTVRTRGGGRYNPLTDSWTSVSEGDSLWATKNDTVVWTGSEMIISRSDGAAAYNPFTDTWRRISSYNGPTGGRGVWTGSEMIIWTGFSGARYTP